MDAGVNRRTHEKPKDSPAYCRFYGICALSLALNHRRAVSMDIRSEITKRIQEAFPDTEVTLTDMTGTNDHWEAMIVSPSFEGMSRLQRQRGIYAALGELMRGPIHALTFRTLTPEQLDLETP